ncbi:DNA ligase 3 isoform X1 [Lepeophtheirus salmonis]|uniref:DNA ligase 3 isoform X1 n=2 Tax=Lepeophtheirus salmonis TaxID=72036 RepID=UPI001AE1CFBA|nr:DNA ligase 3-like isoform X1 [Lepeophtheirus salmonis]
MTDNKYSIDYAKRPAGCKKCKEKMLKGALRIAKITASPFSDDGEMKLFHHPACIFQTFQRVRPNTKIIEEPGDLEGWESVTAEDKEMVLTLIREAAKNSSDNKASKKKAPTPKKKTPSKEKSPSLLEGSPSPMKEDNERPKMGDPACKDNSFSEFIRLCNKIADEPSYNAKTEIMAKFFRHNKFEGDLHVWIRLLLPGVVKRVYNLQSKTLVKIYSKIFEESEDEMLEDLEAGDVAGTIATFFEKSESFSPLKKSSLNVFEVDSFLKGLCGITTEDKQMYELKKITKKCTLEDLTFIIRLIKGDLRMQAGSKPVLTALHPDAYEAFNSSRNVDKVIESVLTLRSGGDPKGTLNVGATLMNPIQPMLAQACKSVDMAFKKFPKGMYSEIKYDGERVQLHKRGKEFAYFSRSLKPVMAHKVKIFKEYIPEAFPDGSDLILDAEVLMVDNKTGDPLPFGSLGVHKGSGFKDATPCLFIFDCIYYNGENLMDKPIHDRRKLLSQHMVEVGNYIKFSEMKVIKKKSELGEMIQDVLKKGLEGLVLKDINSTYEPGKRHWLKVKKDYLNDGAMADTADLVVLGGWFGTGQKGGIVSIFLMGCYDTSTKKWMTVTKVHGGFDDATLEDLQDKIVPLMKKIKGDYDSVPSWLKCNRGVVPDFIVNDPKVMPVWEITGAEFSKSDIHTANGISIRFPRVTKQRKDKNWKTATNLEELIALYKTSKENVDFDIDFDGKNDSINDNNEDIDGMKENSDSSPPKKIKLESPNKMFSKGHLLDPRERSPVKVTLGKSNRSFDKIEISNKYGLDMFVKQGDIFKDSPRNASLAHCISLDYSLGKGIAKTFRQKFNCFNQLSKVKSVIGGLAVLKDGDRYIYNLVTKAKYSDKPTYDNLKKSLEAMRLHAEEKNVSEIAMPKIGCRLDGLQWNAVRTLIKNVFLKTEITLTIFSLQDESPSILSEVSISKETIEKRQLTQEVSNNDLAPPSKKLSLEDPFIGTKILLKPGLSENNDLLTRHIITFGGKIVEDFEEDKATHIVYPNKSVS